MSLSRRFHCYRKDKKFSDILGLFYSNNEELKATTRDIEGNDREGVCFIIDGLDEYQPQNRTSVIYKLLDKTFLPQAMVIVSFRPVATKLIVTNKALTKRIEVFGFSKKQIFDYIDRFHFNDGPSSSALHNSKTDQSKLKDYLHSHPNMFDMCYLPVHAAMICYLYKCGRGQIPNTQTKSYEHFTQLIIYCQLTRHSREIELHSLQDLNSPEREYAFLHLK